MPGGGDVTIAGDDAAVAVADRPGPQRIRDEPDVAVELRLYAEGAAAVAERSARLQPALRYAAPDNATIAELWAAMQAERLTGMTMLARTSSARVGCGPGRGRPCPRRAVTRTGRPGR